MYKPSDAAKLRDQITIALQAAIQEVLQGKISMKVNSSSITHTGLEPSGDMFTITYQVVIHPKKEKPDDVRVEP